MATSAETREDASGPPPNEYREHLRKLTDGLALTRELIQSGAAAVTESVKLLNRLDGRAAVQADGHTDGAGVFMIYRNDGHAP